MATLTDRYPGPRIAGQRSRFSLGDLAFWPAVVFVALFSGLLCAYMPWWLVLGMVAVLGYPLLLWVAPWAGIGFYAVAMVLSPDFKYSDVMTAMSLTLIGIKMLSAKDRVMLPRSVLWPLAIFLGLVLLSLALAIGVFHHTVPFIYRDGRAFLYWLWLPLLYWMALSEPAGHIKLARVVLFAAIAIASIAIIQYVFQIQIVREGRVGGLETLGTFNNDITRVQMQGFAFVMVGLVWALVIAAQGGRRLFYALPLLLLFAAAIYLNFGRALWAWTTVAVLMSGLVLGLRRAALLGMALTALSVLGLVALFLVRPAVIDTAVERLASVADEGAIRTSGGWRTLENEASRAQITQSPLVGIGVGGEYRRWVYEIRIFAEHTRYVHNGYLFIALKLGIPALLVLLWLTLKPWWSAFRERARTQYQPRSMWIAIVASWLPIMGLSFTQPEIVTPQTVLLMCLGLTVMIGRPQEAGAAAPRLRSHGVWRPR